MLAQLVEHRYRKPAVTGSTPAHGILDNELNIYLPGETLLIQRFSFFVSKKECHMDIPNELLII